MIAKLKHNIELEKISQIQWAIFQVNTQKELSPTDFYNALIGKV